MSHLRGVADLARRLAEGIRPGDRVFAESTYWAGLLHDVGKYQEAFQQRLGGAPRAVEHSGYGAALAFERGAMETAFVVAGHHAGIPCRTGAPSSLKERCARLSDAAKDLLPVIRNDAPELAAELENLSLPQNKSTPLNPLNADLRIRMIFSCVVDADRLDTEGHRNPEMAEIRDSAKSLEPERRLKQVLDAVESVAKETKEGPVKKARMQVLAACLRAAWAPGHLFSLTAPTGGGKTLASLAFALKRAALYPGAFDRVLVVIPYLSIIEQNAHVYRKALGDDAVLEHHSAVRDRLIETSVAGQDGGVWVTKEESADEPEVDRMSVARRLAAENWDAPFVVTTSVRFFESLFSNHPSDCRRLHNIARSIVILDEVQTIPAEFLSPILSMMEALSRDYGTIFIFCTATQPAFQRSVASAGSEDARWAPGTIREIMDEPEPQSLFHSLRRVEVSWPARHIGGGGPCPTPWGEIASAMVRERRALCIVNTRDQARTLFERIERDCTDASLKDGLFHLSTRMCPKHRLDRIDEIKSVLAQESRPCLVAATQLIEAGVDLDFPVVYRAMGPFEAIIQSAGRCDREGRLTEAAGGRPAGRVFVFETEDGKTPPGVYRLATEKTRSLLMRSNGTLSIHEPRHVQRYYESLYAEVDTDARQIQDWRTALNFPEVSERFSLIADNTRAVLIPFDAEARSVIEALRRDDGRGARSLARRAQAYVVGLYPNEFRMLSSLGAIHELEAGLDVWVCAEGYYDPSIGLTTQPRPARCVFDEKQGEGMR